MPRPFLLFHWSPVARRPQILRRGLCPGATSRDGQWKPPYVCFSRSPSQAWGLSADLTDTAGAWDLWMVWSSQLEGYEMLAMNRDGSAKPSEYRVYHRIPKRAIWYVGMREHRPRARRDG